METSNISINIKSYIYTELKNKFILLAFSLFEIILIRLM